MKRISEQAITEKIKQREKFSATIEDGAFSLKIEKYEPALCTAIHNGGNLRPDLEKYCLLSQKERYYEEDPFTGSFIEQQAITLIAHDSRFEYDLNRNIKECVYEMAWGKKVWSEPLSDDAVAASKKKHAQFYRIVSAVVEALAEDFGRCLVYDIHSYNYQRHERDDLPVFNLGTSSVKHESWRPAIDFWLAQLKKMSVEGVDITAAENDIFFGKGNLAAHCHSMYDNVLVLATEVKKVYMDELTGEEDVLVLPSMQRVFNKSVSSNTEEFISRKKHR